MRKGRLSGVFFCIHKIMNTQNIRTCFLKKSRETYMVELRSIPKGSSHMPHTSPQFYYQQRNVLILMHERRIHFGCLEILSGTRVTAISFLRQYYPPSLQADTRSLYCSDLLRHSMSGSTNRKPPVFSPYHPEHSSHPLDHISFYFQQEKYAIG